MNPQEQITEFPSVTDQPDDCTILIPRLITSIHRMTEEKQRFLLSQLIYRWCLKETEEPPLPNSSLHEHVIFETRRNVQTLQDVINHTVGLLAIELQCDDTDILPELEIEEEIEEVPDSLPPPPPPQLTRFNYTRSASAQAHPPEEFTDEQKLIHRRNVDRFVEEQMINRWATSHLCVECDSPNIRPGHQLCYNCYRANM